MSLVRGTCREMYEEGLLGWLLHKKKKLLKEKEKLFFSELKLIFREPFFLREM